MGNPEGHHGDFVHTSTVEGDDDLVKNLIHSEEALTSRDIDQYVDQVIEAIRENEGQAEYEGRSVHDFIIEDLIQDKILDAFSKEVLKNYAVVRDLVEKTTKRILVVYLREKYPNQEISSKDIPSFAKQDQEFSRYAQAVAQEARRKHVQYNAIEDPEYRQGIEKIQKVVMERLRQRLADEGLSDVEKSVSLIEKTIHAHKPHIKVITDMRGVQHVLRRDRMGTHPWTRPEDEATYNQALQKFLQMPENPHILNYKYYDKENRRAKVEFQEGLGDLFSELNSEQPILSSVEVLSVLNDNIKGAVALEKEGLGMMDISLPNMGFKRDNGGKLVGLLPDPEGIYPLNEMRTHRIANGSTSADPDSGKEVLDYWPPEVPPETSFPFTNKEVVFQFGVCLKFIIEDLEYDLAEKIYDERQAEEIIIELDLLAQRMTSFDPNLSHSEAARPSLAQAQKELESLIEEIQRALEVQEEPERLAA